MINYKPFDLTAQVRNDQQDVCTLEKIVQTTSNDRMKQDLTDLLKMEHEINGLDAREEHKRVKDAILKNMTNF